MSTAPFIYFVHELFHLMAIKLYLGACYSMIFVLVAAGFALTSFLVTRFGNVPINQEIKTWSATDLPSDWEFSLLRWNTHNAVRTLSAIACFISLLISTYTYSRTILK